MFRIEEEAGIRARRLRLRSHRQLGSNRMLSEDSPKIRVGDLAPEYTGSVIPRAGIRGPTGCKIYFTDGAVFDGKWRMGLLEAKGSPAGIPSCKGGTGGT